jgi:hypothetical protein
MVIDSLVRGVDSAAGADESPVSLFAALGWRSEGAVTAIAGSPPPGRSASETLEGVHRAARRAGFDVLAGVHGGRLLVVLGGIGEPLASVEAVIDEFGDGPVVFGASGSTLSDAAAVTTRALSGLRAVIGWPAAARPISADELLPERALAGDAEARGQLITSVYRPLVDAGDVLLETVVGYLESGRALETTARGLFVHTNTVRYRLRRVAELCGHAPTDARGAFVIQVALVLGRLADPEANSADSSH